MSSRLHHHYATSLIGLAVMVTAACAGPDQPPPRNPDLWRPSVSEPVDGAEREILLELPSLAPGQQASIAGRVVVAEAPYPAASARTCREVHISSDAGGPERARLACREDDAWFFVPEVFQPQGDHETEP
ncbi:hypothetical protein [Haliangium sp.]|uniref:hypothetical protein n=1 Tax=Haliangium sp. TaxID=2663208 RepID=UPI003D0BFB1C